MIQRFRDQTSYTHLVVTLILHTLSLSVSVVCAVSRLSSSAILAASNEPSLPETASEDWGEISEMLINSASVKNNAIHLACAWYLPQLQLFSTVLVSPSSSG